MRYLTKVLIKQAQRFPECLTGFGFWLAFGLACLIFFGGTSFMLGKDSNWDLKNYHLYNAYSFLFDRIDLDQHPASGRTFFNPVLDVITYPLLTSLPDWLGGSLLGAFQGIGLIMIMAIGLELLGKSLSSFYLSLITVIISATGAMTWSEIGTTFGDLTTAVWVLAAFYFLLKALQTESLPVSMQRFGLAGLWVGIATGLKLTNAVYALALIVSAVFSARTHKTRVLFCTGLSALLSLSALEGGWALELYQRYGNPVFPAFNALWQSPYYPSINAPACINFPKDLLQTFFFPFYFSWNHQTEWTGSFRDFRFPAAYIAIIGLIALSMLQKRSDETNLRLERSLILFMLIAFIAWQNLFSIQRYAIVLEMLSPLVCVLFLKQALQPLSRKEKKIQEIRLTILTSLVLLSLILTTQTYRYERTHWTGKAYSTATNFIKPKASAAAIILGQQGLAYLAPTLDLTDVIWVYQSQDEVDKYLGIPPFSLFDQEIMDKKIMGKPMLLMSEVGIVSLRQSRKVLTEFKASLADFCQSFYTSFEGTYIICPLVAEHTADILRFEKSAQQDSIELIPKQTKIETKSDQKIGLTVSLRNTGPRALIANCADSLLLAGEPVQNLPCGNKVIAHRLFNRKGQQLGWETPRTRIPKSLAVNESISFDILIQIPNQPAQYTLEFKLEEEDLNGKVLSSQALIAERTILNTR